MASPPGKNESSRIYTILVSRFYPTTVWFMFMLLVAGYALGLFGKFHKNLHYIFRSLYDVSINEVF